MKLVRFQRSFLCLCVVFALLCATASAQSVSVPELPGQSGVPELPGLQGLNDTAPVSQRLPYEAHWELFRLSSAPEDLLAVLWVEPDPNIHAYAHEPGSAMAKPTNLKVTVKPENIRTTISYPPGTPKQDPLFPEGSVDLYEKPTPLFVTLHGAASAESLTLDGRLNMLLCSDKSCWYVDAPRSKSWTNLRQDNLADAGTQAWWGIYASLSTPATPPITEPVATSEPAPAPVAPAPEPAPQELENSSGWLDTLQIAPRYFQMELEVSGLAKAILFGLLAGFILNFMPCVLPVVSLKLSSLMAVSGLEDKSKRTRHFREHNIFFSLGILSYFLLLGVVFGLADLAWGQLFQQAGAMMILMALVFVLGLSLFGVFDLPVLDLKTGIDTSKSPRLQALFTGLLATLLATPCSGPFLGGVLGWTLNRPPETVIMVFISIGLGMALPYITMIFFPGLVRIFPRPGGWNVHLERVVGFFLMATALYLFTILPESYEVRALVLLWCAGLAAWIWGKWTTLSDSRRKRWSVRALALAVMLGAGLFALSTPGPLAHWKPFNEQQFRQELGKRPLLVDFTADWCPNCKFLELSVLTPKNLTKWRDAHGLVLLQADMTQDNPAAEILLRKLGSNSIPVVALFPAGDQSAAPLVLRDLFTTSQLQKALKETIK